jgi:hypothetical protein
MGLVQSVVSGILCFRTAGANHSYWNQTTDTSRRRDYYINLLMNQGTSKEIRIFKLGEFIINKWNECTEILRKEKIILNSKGTYPLRVDSLNAPPWHRPHRDRMSAFLCNYVSSFYARNTGNPAGKQHIRPNI